MQLIRRSDRGRAARLPALHRGDVEAVLGRPDADTWNCMRCGVTQRVPPSAYVKVAGTLEPLCFSCFVETGFDPTD